MLLTYAGSQSFTPLHMLINVKCTETVRGRYPSEQPYKQESTEANEMKVNELFSIQITERISTPIELYHPATPDLDSHSLDSARCRSSMS